MAKPIWIPVLPRHKIRIFRVDGDGYRFAELFAQTWRQIPLGCRRRLLKFWRTTPLRGIELIAGKSDFARGNSGCAISQHKFCLQYSSIISFDSRYMDRLSDGSVKTVIAHELAHVVMIQEDDLSLTYDEEYADDLTNLWGFDTDALDTELEQCSILNQNEK